MRSRMSPTGHVPLSDLPDRQSLLCASLGSFSVTRFFRRSQRLFAAGRRRLLYSVWISALFCLAAQRRSLAGLHPRPQREVVILASVVSI